MPVFGFEVWGEAVLLGFYLILFRVLLKVYDSFFYFFRLCFGSLIGTGPLWSSPPWGHHGCILLRRFMTWGIWLGFCLILFRVLLKKSSDLFSHFFLPVLFGLWLGQDLFGRSALGSSCLYFWFRFSDEAVLVRVSFCLSYLGFCWKKSIWPASISLPRVVWFSDGTLWSSPLGSSCLVFLVSEV
jgi:hypothetical protein